MPLISFSEIGNKIQAHDSGIFAIAGNLYGLRQELKEKYKIGE